MIDKTNQPYRAAPGHRRAILASMLCALALDLFGGAAQAQTSPAGSVSGVGTAIIERPAEILRMHIVITAKHAELTEAMAKLKERKAAAVEKLKTLGAVPGSVEFSPAQLGTGSGSPETQMQRMVMMRMQGRDIDEDALSKLPKSVSLTLTADWPLDASDAEALLLQADALQQKIKEADLASGQDADALSPEQQELVEEMEGLGSYEYGMRQTEKPGEPSFQYVIRVTDEQRARSIEEAYQNARTQAARLARAAGASLGPLRSLSSLDATPGGEGDTNSYSRYMRQMMLYGQAAKSLAAEADENEAIGTQPAKVTYRTVVNATFALEASG